MERIKIIIHRSIHSLEAQAIYDGKTVLGRKFKYQKGTYPQEQSKNFGLDFGKSLQDKKISEVAFDRNGLKYHGNIKSFAEGLREAGLKF